jgi:hypothetical protein
MSSEFRPEQEPEPQYTPYEGHNLPPELPLPSVHIGRTGMSGYAAAHREQAPKPSPEDTLRKQITDEVDQVIQETKTSVAAGETPHHSIFTVAYLSLTKAQEAAQKNDTAQLEEQIIVLQTLPDVDASYVAEACYAGLATGSGQAATTLHQVLATEKEKGQLPSSDGIHDIDDTYQTEALEAVIKAWEKDGMPSEGVIEGYALIDQYAPTRENRWQQYARHYNRTRDVDTASAVNVEQRDMHLAELIEEGTFSDEFILRNTKDALTATDNPDLREQLKTRFVDVANGTEATVANLSRMVEVGTELLNTGEPYDGDTIQAIKGFIADDAMLLRPDEDTSPHALARQMIPWHAKLAEKSGATPKQIIEALFEQASEETVKAHPAEQAHIAETVIETIDAACTKYAEQFAQHNDFETAGQFVGAIIVGSEQQRAIRTYLRAAQTSEDINILRANANDLLTYQLDTSPHLHFAYARVHGKTDRTMQLAFKQTKQLFHPDPLHRRGERACILDAYQTIVEQRPDQALPFAKQLLHIVRQKGSTGRYLQQLSDALIASGDIEEAELARHDILSSDMHPSSKLLGLHRITQLLPPQAK